VLEWSFLFHSFVQKCVDKDVHLVIEFLELEEYYGHFLHEKGINSSFSLRIDNVC